MITAAPSARMAVGVRALGVVAGGAALGAFGWVAAGVLGWALLAGVAAMPVLVAIARRPLLAVSVLLVAVLMLEGDSDAFLGASFMYRLLPGAPAQPTDLLLGLAVLAVGGDALARRRPLVLPGRFTFPLIVLVAALVSGATTGWFGGGNMVVLLNAARVLLYLVVVPLLTVQVLDRPSRLRFAAGGVPVLVGVKAVVGLMGWLLGEGRLVGDSLLIYYGPTPNFVLMVFLLTVLAAAAARVPLPRWSKLVALLASATFVLSYRRSFWIAFALAAVVVLLVASGRRGRPVVLVLLVSVAAAVWSVLSFADRLEEVENPVVERIQSLSPDRVEMTPDDRYRLDEQRNVIEEIRRSPVRGIGLGVPWSARHPLPLEFDGGRHYTHTTLLWYWLNLGLIGAAAYVLLVATYLRSAAAVWRRSADRRIRVIALAAGAGLLGLAVAETTASFTGVDPRITIVVAFVLGWLAAAEELAAVSGESERGRREGHERLRGVSVGAQRFAVAQQLDGPFRTETPR